MCFSSLSFSMYLNSVYNVQTPNYIILQGTYTRSILTWFVYPLFLHWCITDHVGHFPVYFAQTVGLQFHKAKRPSGHCRGACRLEFIVHIIDVLPF